MKQTIGGMFLGLFLVLVAYVSVEIWGNVHHYHSHQEQQIMTVDRSE